MLCHNCHGEIHAKLIPKKKIDAIRTLNYGRYQVPTDVVKWHQKIQGGR